MAGEADDEDQNLDLNDDLDLNEDDQLDADGDDEADDQDADDADKGDDDADGEETLFSFSDEEDPDADQEGDSSVIRALRKELRETKAKARDLERANVKPTIEVGEKPTLASCDFDEDKYEAELDAWKERKRTADAEVEQGAERDRRVQESWQKDVSAYQQRKATIGVPDFDHAEETVRGTLNDVQQAVLVKAATDPAALVVALSRSPAKLAEIAKFDDPIKLAAAIARMEGTVKVIKRKKGPEVDRPQNGSARMPGGTDQVLAKLEKDAEKTGDRTKLIAYKAKQKKGGK